MNVAVIGAQRRGGPWARALGVAALMIAALTWGTPATAADVDYRVRHVIVVGVSGLTWDDVSAEKTPNLWRLAQRGAMGSLSVRSAGISTCPDDGWLTLSAGNRARGLPERSCPDQFPIAEPVQALDGSASLPEQSLLIDRNANLRHGAKPGTLASSVRCTTAIGQEAAVGAAHPDGSIDRYFPALPGDARAAFELCPLTLVSLGRLDGEQQPTYEGQIAELDKSLGVIDAARPRESLLMVLGVSDISIHPRLHVAVVDGPGFDGRWLTSPSTRREPFVQLIDVAPTVFHALGVGTPPSVAGREILPGGTRGTSTADAVAELMGHDTAAQKQRPLVQPFFTAVVVLNMGLLIAATWYFRRREQAVADLEPDPSVGLRGEHEPPSARHRTVARGLEAAAIAVACVPGSSYLANVLPWWGWPGGPALHLLSIALIAALLAVAAFYGPWGRSALGPSAFAASVTAVVLGADVFLGSPLQLDALAGYSPLVAGRFVGFGNLAFAVFAGAALLGATFFAQSLSGRKRVVVLVLAGLVALLLVGSPAWGSDVGGIVALTPAFVAAILRAAGVWLSTVRVLACVVAGLIAVSVFGLIDYARPDEERTHLGRFVAQLRDGTAGVIVQRKAEANFTLLLNSQLTLLVIAVAVFVPLVLLRRSAGLRRVFGLFPCVRAGAVGALVAALIGFAVNDSGIAVPAFMSAIVIPLLIATTLRVLIEAHQGIVPHVERTPISHAEPEADPPGDGATVGVAERPAS